MDELNYIGESIYEYRRSHNISMDALSKSSKVSKSMISQIESGKVNPTVNALYKLAKAMDKSLAELVDPKNRPQKYTRSYLGQAKATYSKDKSFMCHQLNSNSLHSGLRIDYFEFLKRGEHGSIGHGRNSIEYLFVESGEIEIEYAGQIFALKQGEIFEFKSDTKHIYKQKSRNHAKGIIIIYYL